jgi:hypothetical protein
VVFTALHARRERVVMVKSLAATAVKLCRRPLDWGREVTHSPQCAPCPFGPRRRPAAGPFFLLEVTLLAVEIRPEARGEVGRLRYLPLASVKGSSSITISYVNVVSGRGHRFWLSRLGLVTGMARSF